MSKNSKKEKKIHSVLPPKHGQCPLRKRQRSENSWWIPERRCTWKDFISRQLDALRKFKDLTVQTSEEAQEYVHDLDLFVTVQILDETLAVLPLGKSCEEHGFTCEWASGQKPELTKNGKVILCKTENFVPIVVPGLPTGSCSSISSASPVSSPQDPSDDPSLSPATIRSDSKHSSMGKTVAKSTKKQPIKIGAAYRQQETACETSPEDTRVPAVANTSHDSDSPTKVASGKQSICAYFPKSEVVQSASKSRRLGLLAGSGLSQSPQFSVVHAVVVQDSATQCIQSCSNKTKTFQ